MRIFYFIPFLILLVSCNHQQTNNSKKENAVEAYIKEHTEHLDSLAIIEESEIDSIYSPFNELLSLSYIYLQLDRKVLECSNKIFEMNNKKEAIACIDSVLSEYEKENEEIEPVADKCFRALEFDLTDNCTKNRIYQKVKYILNGKSVEQRFYYNKNDNRIGHTDEDIAKKAKEVIYNMKSSRRSKLELENDKRDIKKGIYQFKQ